MQKRIIDDLDALLNILPPHISEPLWEREDRHELLEVVMDLGRPPEARFPEQEVILSPLEVTAEDIEYVVSRVGVFSGDNRAGIERTLHRISAIRNRQGRIVGLTCRVGRAVFGTMRIIEDLVQSGKSILLLGRPGVGKTTMLREVARVLADDLKKRVIIVDTSNEIAGDGDIPHPAIGHARRMQVTAPTLQHAVMIEAVENHMPEAIIIDEIGTELEAAAARTIAERGVQLVGTAHGNTLENLILNPTLSDLIGGIQTVTLGDEEARRRGTQKSILERKAPPTFDVVVEIQDFNTVTIHPDVAEAVDAILRGRPLTAEIRWLDEEGEVRKEKAVPLSAERLTRKGAPAVARRSEPPRLFPFGINRARLEQAAREMRLPIAIATDLKDADLVVTSKNYYRRKPQKLRDAELAGLPLYVLKSNALSQMKQLLDSVYADEEKASALRLALREAEEGIAQVIQGKKAVELSPQSAYIRRLQHLMAERCHLSSRSRGKEPYRRVEIFREGV
jgi:stage III sporulation protein SpoIIIAA